jgi:hypothetical protein
MDPAIRGIDDIRSWPPVEELRAAWRAIGGHLSGVLPWLLGLVAFLTQHDSHHVGQAAFLRRQLGRPGMAYTRSADGRAGR